MTKRQRQRKFLEELAKHGVVREAAWLASPKTKKRGDAARTFHRWRLEDPKFAAQWDQAMQDAEAVIRMELHRRGVEGWEEVRTDEHGKVVSRVRRFSDAVLLALAKHRLPDFGAAQAEIQIGIDFAGFAKLTRESRDDLRRILVREMEGQQQLIPEDVERTAC